MDISGTCDDRLAAVGDAFAGNFEAGGDTVDVGAAVAVTIEGELVVDLWGGTVSGDDDVERPWQPDTIINVFSTTKTVSALACLMLADAGELDLYAPVYKVWPEFRANNKAAVEVRHVMSHTAGLPSWSEPVTVDVLYDWDQRDVAARRPGAVVGAGDGVGLPRPHPGLPRG